jgi:hypothetical protein
LKLHHIATSLDPKTLNVLTDRWFESQKLINKLIDEDESIYHVTEHLIDFDIKNY